MLTAGPLAGRRVLVTRSAQQAGKLSDGLRALGAEPVEVPLLEIQPPASYEPLDRSLRTLAAYDWLILTSANAVQAIVKRAEEIGLPRTTLAGPTVAAVGKATAEAARAAGFAVDFLPERYVAESLVEGLSARSKGKRVLLLRAEVARDVIPVELRAAGAEVEVVDAYRNAMPELARERLQAALAMGLDAAAFTSSSSVTRLREAVQAAEAPWPLAGVKAVSIGPITSQTLRENDWAPDAEADPHDLAGLLDALVGVFRD